MISAREPNRGIREEEYAEEEATVGSYATVWDLFMEAQEHQARLTKSFFEGAIGNLRTQAERTLDLAEELVEQARRGQEATKALARESVSGYTEFLNSPFFCYRESVRAAEGRSSRESRYLNIERSYLAGLGLLGRSVLYVAQYPIAAPSPRGSDPPVNRTGLPSGLYSIVRPWALPIPRTSDVSNCTLWPRADNWLRTDCGMPASTKSTFEDAKLTRGAAIACWISMPKSIMFISICDVVWGIVRPPGVPIAIQGLPSLMTRVGQSP